MGWTQLHRPKGMNDFDFFRQEFGDSFSKHWMILAHNSDRDGFYAAIEDSRYPEGDAMRHWILVIAKQWSHREHMNFFYKDMSDTMGPGIDGASLKVINAVPPTEHEYAKAWRERVVKLREQEKQIKSALGEGATIILPHPLRYADGVEESKFTVFKRYTGKLAYRRASDGVCVRLSSDWKKTLGVQVQAA